MGFNAVWPPSSNGTWSPVIEPTQRQSIILITDGSNLFHSGNIGEIWSINPDTLTETKIRNTGQHWPTDGGTPIIFKGELYCAGRDTSAFTTIFKYDGTGTNWTEVFNSGVSEIPINLFVIDVLGTETLVLIGQKAAGFTEACAISTDGSSFTYPLSFPEAMRVASNPDSALTTRITTLSTMAHRYSVDDFTEHLMELVGTSFISRETGGPNIVLGTDLYWNASDGNYTVSVNPAPSWTSPSDTTVRVRSTYGLSNYKQFGYKGTDIRYWDHDNKQWFTSPVDTTDVGYTINSAICVTNSGKAFMVGAIGSTEVLLQRNPDLEGAGNGGNGGGSVGNLWVYKTTDKGVTWVSKGIHT